MEASSKKQVLEILSELAASVTGLEQREIFNALIGREKLGCTGVGHGFSIPHAQFDNISKMYGFFAHLAHPVDFEAEDGDPVDLIFLLLVPRSANVEHLKALNTISRLFRDPEIREKLRSGASRESLYNILTEVDADN